LLSCTKLINIFFKIFVRNIQQDIIVASAALFSQEKMRGTSILLLNLFTTDAFSKAFIVKLGEQ
jgi:hypothetical protein